MDVNIFLHNLISQQESALIAGVISALTPCVLPLIPILLYRFGIWGSKGNKQWKDIALFLAGFTLSFVGIGISLHILSNSLIINGVRLLLGVMLITAGAMQLIGFITPQVINRFSHPFAIGLLFPIVVAVSPCVLPYFSTLTVGTAGLTKALLFALGLASIPLTLILTGTVGQVIISKSKPVIRLLEKASPLLLILSGFYMGSQMIDLSKLDILVTTLFTFGIIFYVGFRMFYTQKLITIFNLQNIAISITLLVVISIILYSHAPNTTIMSGEALVSFCTQNLGQACAECRLAQGGFLAVYLALVFAYQLRYRPSRKISFGWD